MKTQTVKTGLDTAVQHLFDEEVYLTGITEYGVSWESLTTGKASLPRQGARFDIAFEGKLFGDKINGQVKGIDYLEVRADGQFRLHLYATITTGDGQTIALREEGTMVLKPNGTAQLYLQMQFSSASPKYEWINEKQVWGIGTSYLQKGLVTISGFTS